MGTGTANATAIDGEAHGLSIVACNRNIKGGVFGIEGVEFCVVDYT